GGIAGLLADVLLRSRRYTEMKRLATIDPLTGLLNRSQMDVLLKTEAERANRYKFSLALVMMDLDHFKRINDTHGHAKGDDVLRVFASILKNGTRRVDYLIRYGGEEFLALLPHIPKENAKIYAERIRRTTSESLYQDAGLPEPCTVSIGIACLPEDGQTPQGALESADKALYAAKDGGRDCVVLFT
ncbi:MAG: GGDEF domain-containing protein, partial [Deltaproteobacteria bacterium]|nr:GGDEF domain-containing protein [Deltaproteobacteria bacterium]